MSTITKKELIDRIIENTNAKRVVVKAVIQSFLGEVVSELAKGNRLEFRDFGVFEVREQAARTAQNPKLLGESKSPQSEESSSRWGGL
ncbi:MAG: HU family DNA-binding protein [Phycisphaerales bacterium]|nr:MAG: HU family DNA-binding protein [Phycisphaerales bacterium]